MPEGTLIAFSTSAGMTAVDGSGNNSPYTEQLVRVLRSRPEQGLELVDVFREASRAVKQATGQTPWLNMEASLPTFHLWKADRSAPPKQIVNSIGMKLVLIPAGEFMMGSPESEESRGSDETQHRVRITKPFYLGAYEVTQHEYEQVMGNNPSYCSANGKFKERVVGMDTSRHPVENVSWEDAVAFCQRLSQKEGKQYRLPTEAQWEYACRAGTSTPFNFGSTL